MRRGSAPRASLTRISARRWLTRKVRTPNNRDTVGSLALLLKLRAASTPVW
jgi:hypothetical protein